MSSAAGRILALHEDSNSCAALFVDGRLEFAAAEERFTRIRFHAGHPARTLACIRERYGLDPRNVDAVVPANQFSFLPSLPFEALPQEEHDMFRAAHKAYLLYQQALWRSKSLRAAVLAANGAMLRRRFPKMVHLGDHHTAHA
jgi:predicted NodU family carbamoyl transferase